MSISDEMMWRYYELLTDVPSDQIAAMPTPQVGKPSDGVKERAGASIVADFHSEDAATGGGGLGEAISETRGTDDIEEVKIIMQTLHPRHRQGFPARSCRQTSGAMPSGESGTDAQRKIKQHEVHLDSTPVVHPVLVASVFPFIAVIRAYRRLKKWS